MAGLIDRYKREDFTISQRTSISDGKPVFTTISARGFSIDMSYDSLTAFGNVHRGKVFYVAPLDSTPTMPCQITHDGLDYDVKSIEVLRTLSGVLWGYRLTAVGG